MKNLFCSFFILTLFACNSPGVNKDQFVLTTVNTDFSKGRLGLEHKISLLDVEKFHRYLCDGLVVGFLGLQEGLKILYPDGKIDRPNTRIISRSSPCLGDAAAYLCRYQFNTFYVNNNLDGLYTIQRIDNNKAVRVFLNESVNPKEIDVLGKQTVAGQLNVSDLQQLKKMEDDFTIYLLTTKPEDNFTITNLADLEWNPILKNDFIKTDIINKNK